MYIYIYIHPGFQTCQQRICRIRKFNFNGKPLHNFYKVTTGIIRWQQSETGAGSW